MWGRAHDHRRPITGISLERFENENEFFRKHENNLISELSLCLSENDEMQFNHLIAIHAVGFLKRIALFPKPHPACMGLCLSRRHDAISVVLCHSILLFDLRRKYSFVPTAYLHRRRAQRQSRTALLQRRRRLVLDGREHGGRLPAIGWLAAR